MAPLLLPLQATSCNNLCYKMGWTRFQGSDRLHASTLRQPLHMQLLFLAALEPCSSNHHCQESAELGIAERILATSR